MISFHLLAVLVAVVLLQATTRTTTNATCYTYRNANCRGNIYTNTRGISRAECEDMCTDESQCKSFLYIDSTTENDYIACFLIEHNCEEKDLDFVGKPGYSYHTKSPCISTSPSPTTVTATSCYTYRSGNCRADHFSLMSRISLARCEDACTDAPRCKSYQFINTTYMVYYKQCFLMEDICDRAGEFFDVGDPSYHYYIKSPGVCTSPAPTTVAATPAPTTVPATPAPTTAPATPAPTTVTATPTPTTAPPKCKAGQRWFAPAKKCFPRKTIRTRGGNAGGANCVIPYKYKGKWEATCVPGSHGRYCGTTEDFDKDGKWGYCPAATCLTDKNEKVHEGEAWTSGGITYICQLDGKGKKSNCHFPFTNKGVVYKNKCAGSYRGWCYTDKDQKKWEYCY